jgi:hypothetical protein
MVTIAKIIHWVMAHLELLGNIVTILGAISGVRVLWPYVFGQKRAEWKFYDNKTFPRWLRQWNLQYCKGAVFDSPELALERTQNNTLHYNAENPVASVASMRSSR